MKYTVGPSNWPPVCVWAKRFVYHAENLLYQRLTKMDESCSKSAGMKDELKSVWMCGDSSLAAVGPSRWSHSVHWNNTTETVIDLWQCGHLAAQLPQVTIKSSFLHWMHNLWTVPCHSCTLILYRYISFHFQPYRDVI